MLTGQTMKNTEKKEWALKILNNCFLRKYVFVVQRAGGRDCLKVMFTSQKYLDINEKYCNRFFGAAVDAQRQDSYLPWQPTAYKFETNKKISGENIYLDTSGRNCDHWSTHLVRRRQ